VLRYCKARDFYDVIGWGRQLGLISQVGRIVLLKRSLKMEVLNDLEIQQVSGGVKAGPAMMLGGTLAAIGGVVLSTVAVPIVVMAGAGLAIGGAGVLALGYAYDMYEMESHSKTKNGK
jgi:hypothetical protein